MNQSGSRVALGRAGAAAGSTIRALWRFGWRRLGAAPVWQKLAGLIVAPILSVMYVAWLMSHSTVADRVLAALFGDRGIEQAGDLRVMAVIGTGAVVGVGLSAGLAFALTRPMYGLIDAMERIERRDLGARVTRWADDEIGDVQDAFNRLAEDLQRSHTELTSRNRDLRFLNELAETVALGQSEERVIAEALPRVLAAIGADCGSVFLPTGDGDLRVHSSIAGCAVPPAAEVTHRQGVRLVDDVLRTATPVTLRGVGAEMLPISCAVEQLFESWVCAPLRVRSTVVGAIGVGRYHPPGLGDREMSVLGAVGNVIGIGLSNAQLLADRERSEADLRRALQRAVEIQEDERRRISRELHDGAGQALTSMVLHLRALQAEESIEILHDRLNGLRLLAADTTEEVRRLSMDLRPALLDDLGLVPALRWLVTRQAESGDVHVALEIENVPDTLSQQMTTALFRMVQEGLTNVVRHSGATQAWVRLVGSENGLVLSISDNGCGIDQEHQRLGLGLVGMRERAQILGGRLVVGDGSRGGTTILAELPPERRP